MTVTGGDGSKLYKYMYYKYQHEINQSRFNGWWTSLAWRIAAHGKILTPPRKNETPWIWGNSVTGFGQPHPKKRHLRLTCSPNFKKKTNTQKKQKIQTTTILLWTLWAISCSEKKNSRIRGTRDIQTNAVTLHDLDQTSTTWMSRDGS